MNSSDHRRAIATLILSGLFAVGASAVLARPLANVPPVSEDDTYDTAVDTALTVPAPGVLDNDYDPNGDPMTAELVSNPSEGGTLVFRPDGSFDYSPPEGYVGNDEFEYRVFDGTEYGNLAGVTIRVGQDRPQLTTYTDESAFLDDLALLGHVVFSEGFEDDAAWAEARSPLTRQEVVSQGIQWTANNAISKVTTGTGPARTGVYGFFCLPHGDYVTGTDCHIPGNCTDGWIGSAPGVLYGFGGWIDGTFGSKVEFLLDGVSIGFDSGSGFLGVILVTGFTRFEIHELEGTNEDAKFIFADDFSFGVPAEVTLTMTREPQVGEVRLDWWGGRPRFSIYRSTDPATVTSPENILAETTDRTWTDPAPPGTLFFYRVSGL